MKAFTVKENVNFKRGDSPVKGMGLGGRTRIEKFFNEKYLRDLGRPGASHQERHYEITDDENLSVSFQGDLILKGEDVPWLPGYLTISGSLLLENSTITKLPLGLHVEKNLDLNGTSVKSVPDDLYVGRDLWIRNTDITALPEGITVKGNIWASKGQVIHRSIRANNIFVK